MSQNRKVLERVIAKEHVPILFLQRLETGDHATKNKTRWLAMAGSLDKEMSRRLELEILKQNAEISKSGH